VSFEHVLVVGAGQMGGGIAQVVAASGRRVSLYDAAPGAVDRGLGAMRKSLEKLAEKDGAPPADVLGRVSPVDDLVPADLMIEAVVEDEAVKAKIFAELDECITDPDAVLASNTSSIPIMKIAAATKNPSRVLGLHFFNPVPVLPLVELITTLVTSEEAAATVEQFAGEVLRKQVVRCGDRSGFIVNALLVPYLLSAIRMAEAGVATVEDIDKAVVAGLSHPMGPLRLSDLIGLDTMKLIADSMYDEYKDPHYAPPPLLLRMVEAGQLGKKSGQGFYKY
jgi:3-hydroxybutyryl-CoA dehydrogenase